MRQGIARILGAGALVLVLGLVSAPRMAHAQPGLLSVTFTPRDTVLSPGADIWVSVDVTDATVGYNGWEAVLSYNPAKLTYVPTVPRSDQQGCLMTGSCKDDLGQAACGSAYIEVSNAADSVYTLDVLLCNQIYLTAPGRLVRYHFRAGSSPGLTTIQMRRITFFNSTWGNPGAMSGPATINIGGVTAVDPPATGSGLRLSATPNPARGAVTLALGSDQSGEQELSVHDIQGRAVRELSSGWQVAGSRQLLWDGTDDSGARVKPGIYLVTLRVGSLRAYRRITILE